MSSKIKNLRRVGIVGLSTVVAASMMSFSAVSAQANWAATGGDIGLVDTDTSVATGAGTQGATLVTPGVAGQALGDMRILVPNLFTAGDTIDLTMFDRTATNASAGDINADLAHRLSFTSVPTVTVRATPVAFTTTVGRLFNTPGNTELATAPAALTPATVATIAPTFATTLVSSSRGGGLTPKATDIVRLTIGNASGGTDTTGTQAKWVITVSGVKADLGASVSPGELRVVPFAFNGAPNTTSSNFSNMFAGNQPDPTEAITQVYNPVINLYTVPAYVAPVSFNIGTPSNIVADGSTQTVGDITIAETNNASIQNGLYTVAVGSAVIRNTATTPVAITTTNAATGETVTTPAAVVGNTLQFTVAGAVDTQKLSIKLSGLLLSDNLKGPISYTLTGGSIGDYLFTPAGSSPAIGTVPADSAFGGASAVNQNDIQAPALVVNAVSTPIAFRIGGLDRYETAAKIALTSGPNTTAILASGENFPDALSSSYLASTFGATIMLTKHNVLPVSTIEAMRLLGTQTVYVIGGTGAINAAVEAKLRATSQYLPGGEVTNGQGKLLVVRLGGVDRYATNKIVNLRASALSTNANPVGRTTITFGQASKLTAFVATGENFPDALAGGPATRGNGSGNLPLILTRTATLSADASSQMTGLGIQQAVILGKEGAVSAAVETSITGLGAAVKRIGGADRYETATLVADFEIAGVTPTSTTTGGLGFLTNRVFLSRGDLFPDALAGGPLAGGLEAPILLTNPNTLTPVTKTWLAAHASRLNFATAFGLGGAVSAGVLDAANAALAG